MAQLAKFHEKAIAIYGCAQIAENTSVINDTPTGTVTTSVSTPTVTGVGTAFDTQVAVGSYIYNAAGGIVGRVLTVTSATSITLEANSAVVISAAAFKTGLGPKNAIAVLNLNFSVDLASEAFQYVGDELNRDEATVITDKFAKFDFETFLPVKGTTTATPLVSEIPISDWFQSSGMAITLAAGKFTVSNSTASNKYMTIEIRRSSPDLTTTQKTYTVTNARGLFDLDMTLGTKPKLKFSYLGNVGSTVAVEKLSIIADFQSQKTTISESLKSSTVNLGNLTVWSGTTEPTSPTFSVSATPQTITGSNNTTNFIFNKLMAPNASGFDYARYLTSGIDGWSKGAAPTDITLTILEDTAASTYNPENNLEASHKLVVNYSDVSDTASKVITIVFHKLELTKVTASKVANYTGQDLGFRNVGYTDIIFS